MKRYPISCCAYSFRDQLKNGEISLIEFIVRCGEMGFDGVELTSYYFPSMDTSFLNEVKHSAAANNLTISGTAIGTDFAQPNPDARLKHVTLTKQWIENTKSLETRTLRVFAGGVREGCTKEDAFGNVREALAECAEYASQQGVILALENHHGLTGTAEDTLRLMWSVDNPSLKLNLDLGNFDTDIYAQFEACAPFAVAVHAKPSAAQTSGVAEIIDYARVRGILESANYNGSIAIEYEESESPDTAIPAFLSRLRSTVG